ncbi:MAG: membrane protein insertase YidC [Mangrovicoccus sp.]|nr:membrane protein insertase YidC [Mangrovicoccus sp.]
MDDQNKNLILATGLSFLVILVWFLLFPPEEPAPDLTQDNGAITATENGVAPAPPATADGTTAPPPGLAQTTAPREAALANTQRIDIATDRLSGSIALTGGRLDDLELKDYRETLDEGSPNVTLLSPAGASQAYYALYGWAPAGDLSYDAVPGAETPWQLEAGSTLTQDSPVTLVWDNGAGLIFRRNIAVDDDYLFTVTQTVENTTDAPVRLAPYGLVARHGTPETINFFILHEGVVQMTDGILEQIKYKNMPDMPLNPAEAANMESVSVAENGWVGFTDKNWMTTLIPTPGQPFTAVAKYVAGGSIYQTETRRPTLTVAPGETAQSDSYLFAGAKEWEAIRGYESDKGIEGFIDSIDWGWFFFLTKPIFWLLHEINKIIGNMGWSIIALTLIIKALLLPLAYKSYVSMAKMKELQPEMEKLKEQAGDDRQKMQQGMMELYKKEKVNPAAGCLPILLQIPIFFSLYKVIFVTIELRHAPWLGWIKDLSAPDPSSILNLFGLLPFAAPEPGTFLAVFSLGVLPIILGVSMWLQQKLNPAPTDPTQKMIFAYMPWIFMFMLGTFASGLVLYWIANNLITFGQQYFIMRSQGYKPDIFGNIKESFKRDKSDAS